MKKLYTIIMGLFITVNIVAQAPEKMSYQAVIRDSDDSVVSNQEVGMQISILKTTSSGTAVYVENHTPTTNINGLVTLEIGTGTTADDFSAIDWASDIYFIKTETDPTGSANYTITGTSQMLSVPYALLAKTAEVATNATIANNVVLKNDSSDQFVIAYDGSGDNLSIEELGKGQVFEIKDGEVYLPQYGGSGMVNLSIDNNGKIIKTAETNQKFGKYDYSVDSSNPTYTLSRKSVYYPDGTILTGMSTLLLDNESGNTGVQNTNFIILNRTIRTSALAVSETIFRINGTDTDPDAYETEITSNVITAGSHIIDNDTYIYFLKIFSCTACDVREVSILK